VKNIVAASKENALSFFFFEEQSGAKKAPNYLSDDKLEQNNLFANADAKEVGAMFERARKGSKLSKVAAAAASGIDRKQIGRLEAGSHSPSLDTLDRYAEALGFEVRVELVPKDS